jgi:hypothetical protein
LNRLTWLLPLTLKCFSLQSLLAWYWISVEQDMREATDAMFRTWLNNILACLCLPFSCWVDKL